MACKINFAEAFNRSDEEVFEEFLRYDMEDTIMALPLKGSPREDVLKDMIAARDKKIRELLTLDGIINLHRSNIGSMQSLEGIVDDVSLDTSSRSRIPSMQDTFFNGIEIGKEWLIDRFKSEMNRLFLKYSTGDLNDIIYSYWKENLIQALDYMLSDTMYKGKKKEVKPLIKKLKDQSGYLDIKEFAFLKGELDTFYYGTLRGLKFLSNRVLSETHFSNLDVNKKQDKMVDSYLRYIIATTMDNLISINFKHISIDQSNYGLDYSPKSKKYSIKKGSSIATSWATEDDAIPVDDSFKIAIETLPLYDGELKTKKRGSIDVRTINSWNSRLYSFANYGIGGNLSYKIQGDSNGDALSKFLDQWYGVFGERPLERYFGDSREDVTLKELIELAPTNPTFFIPAIYAVMANDDRIYSELRYKIEAPDRFSVSSNHRDSVYSLFKGVFDLSNPDSYINAAIVRDADKKAIGFNYPAADTLRFFSLIAQFGTTEFNGILGVDMMHGGLKEYSLDYGRANYYRFSRSLSLHLHPSVFKERHRWLKLSIGEGDYESTIEAYSSGAKLSTYKNGNIESVGVEFDGDFFRLGEFQKKHPDKFNDLYSKLKSDIVELFPALGLDEDLFLQELYANESATIDERISRGKVELLNGFARLVYIAQVQEKLKDVENRDEFEKEAKKYFNYTNRLLSGVTFNVIEPSYGDTRSFVERASRASDLVYGASETTVSRDSSGAMVNNATSSSRGTKIGPIIAELAKENETWAGFDVARMHVENLKIRDIVGAKTKAATKATPAETTMYRYLHGFWAKMYNIQFETKSVVRGSSGLTIHHAVNSDKSNLPASKISAYGMIPFFDENGKRKEATLYSLLNPFGSSNIKDEERAAESLRIFKPIIKQRFRDTIGKINADAFNNIARNLKLISGVLARENKVAVVLNPYSNFQELNKYLVDKAIREARDFSEIWAEFQGLMDRAVKILASEGEQIELDPLVFAADNESMSVVLNPILVDEIFRYGAEIYLDYKSMGLSYSKDNFFIGYDIRLKNRKPIKNHGRILGLQTMDEYFDSLDDLQVTGMLKDMGNTGIHLNHPNMPSSKIIEKFREDQQTLGWADELGRTIFAKIRQTTGEGTYESKIYNMQYFSESKEDSRFMTLKKYLKQHGLFSDNLDPTNPAFSLRAYVQALNEHWGDAVRTRSADRVRKTLIGILKREGFALSKEDAQTFIDNNPDFASRNINSAYLNSLSYKELFKIFEEMEIAEDKVVVKNRGLKKADYLKFLKEEYTKEGLPMKKKGNASPAFELEYNPAIIKFYLTDALLSEQLNTVSSGLAYNLASRYSPEMDVRPFHAFVAGQRTKRNIANSGTKMLHTRNQIDGPSNRIRLAVIGDRKAPVYNLYGDNSKGEKNVNVWDGGTFISPIQRNLEKSSLRHNADGRDAKSLGSSVDKNGNGFLWKAAWFVTDNERIRMSRPMQRLAKMMHNKEIEGLQKTENGEPIVDLFSKGATIYGGAFGFSGNNGNIRLKEVYVYRNGEYYSRTDFRTNEDGTVSFEETPVTVENNSIKKDRRRTTTVKTKKPIKSIYNIWELFGGAYSASIKNGTITHIDDNTSWDNATLVTIYYGRPHVHEEVIEYNLVESEVKRGPRKIVSQEDVYTPFRETLIGHAATAGAIKRGAVNINPADVIYNNNGELSTMEIVNNDMGLQNNPMHYSDEDHISLMTQVINALSARGYSVRQTDLLYQALASLSAANNRALYKALEEGNYNAFLDEFERITAQTIISDNDNSNTIAGAYAELIRPESGRVVDLEKVSKNLAVPPSYMGQLFSKMAAKFTDKGIKLKFNGSMLVLTPSDGIFMMRGDRLSTSKECISESDSIMPNRYYEKDDNAIILAQKKEPALSSIAEIRIDEPFRIEDKDGKKVETPFEQRITHPSHYSIVRDFLRDNPDLVIKRNVLEERDLAPISHLIKTADGNIFSYWEVDAVRRGVHIFNDNEAFEFNGELKTWEDYFLERNQAALDKICEELGIRGVVADFDGPAKKWMERVKQESLQNSHQRISDGKGAIVSVYGKEYVIESVDIRAYEAITTEMYAKALDIDPNAQAYDIESNPFYYIERDLEKLKNKINDPVSKEAYDIKLSGRVNRYFIVDNPLNVSRDVVAKNKLVEIPCEYEQDGDIVYRVLNGRRLYDVPYTVSEDGKTVVDHRVFKNQHGMEIIMTSSVAPFLNSMKYNLIQFSSDIENDNAKKGLLLKFLEDIAKVGEFTTEAIEKIDGFIDYTGIDRGLLGLEVNKKASTITSSGVASENEAIKKALDDAAQKIPGKNSSLPNQIRETFERIIEAKRNGEDVNSMIEQIKNKTIKNIFLTGIKKHVSFLRSLESVASRTPAQSHQSFMPMRIVGFDKAKTNNAYVSRWQQYLQGSDYDVDKVNFLGYAFKNGLYQGWSNFMDLNSMAHLRASETLPFPTGLTLHERGENTGFRMDLEISIIASESPNGIRLTFKNTPGLVVILNDNYEIDESKSSYNGDPLGVNNPAEIHPLDQLALKQFLFERGNANALDAPWIENNIRINMMDHASLEVAFANAVASIIGVEKEGQMLFNSTPDNLMLLSKVIQMYNEMGMVQSSDAAVNFLYDLVNKHNTSFISNPAGMISALENFISAAALNISKDPANLMQATTSVEGGLPAIKEKANETVLAKQSDFFDSNTSASKIRQQELNLGGMDNTGIVASYMKTFEAMAHANYMLLKRHREGDAVSPLFDVSVLGQRKRLLANSYLKITDYRTAEIDQALKEVDNVSDAYLRYSEFLTLSTDNAKDPTLVKLNADSRMIGLYLAGFTLGYDLDLLKGIITSDLGMKIRERMSENIFYGNKASFTVTDAIRDLGQGYDNAPSDAISRAAVIVAKALGLIDPASTSIKPLDVYGSGRGKNTIRDLKIFRSIMQDIVYFDANTETEVHIPDIETVYRRKAETSSWLLDKKELNDKEKTKHDLLVAFVAKLSEKGWNIGAIENDHELKDQFKTLIPEYKARAQAIKNASKYANIKTLRRYAEVLSEIEKAKKNGETEKENKLSKDREQIEKLLSDMGITDAKKEMKNMRVALTGQTDTKKDQAFIDDILSHIENLEALNSAGKDIVDAFHTLDKQVQEMRLISSVIKVNQGLENSIDDFIRYVRNFEGLFSRKSENVKKELVRINKKDYNGQKPSVGEKPLVDLVMFAFNPEYQQAIVNLYETVKFTTNIFEVFRQNKHYMGYIQEAAMFYQGELGGSSVFRELDSISRNIIIGTLGVKAVEAQSEMNKLALNYIYYKQAKAFLGSIDNSDGSLSMNGNKIHLGTRRGAQEFVDYMNTVILPGIARGGDMFSANLRIGATPDPVDGSSSLNYGLGVDMLSTNPNVIPLIASVKAGFNSIANSTVSGIELGGAPVSLGTALFLYNLVVNGNRQTRNAFTGVFTTMIANGSNHIINDYNEFMASLNHSEGNLIRLYKDENGRMSADANMELYTFLAPVVSPYKLSSLHKSLPFAKAVNYNTGKMEFLQRKKAVGVFGQFEDDDFDLDLMGIDPLGSEDDFDPEDFVPVYQRKTFRELIEEASWESATQDPLSIVDDHEFGETTFKAGKYEVRVYLDGKLGIPAELAGLIGFDAEYSILSIEEINDKLKETGRDEVEVKVVEKDSKKIHIPDFGSITSNSENCS